MTASPAMGVPRGLELETRETTNPNSQSAIGVPRGLNSRPGKPQIQFHVPRWGCPEVSILRPGKARTPNPPVATSPPAGTSRLTPTFACWPTSAAHQPTRSRAYRPRTHRFRCVAKPIVTTALTSETRSNTPTSAPIWARSTIAVFPKPPPPAHWPPFAAGSSGWPAPATSSRTPPRWSPLPNCPSTCPACPRSNRLIE